MTARPFLLTAIVVASCGLVSANGAAAGDIAPVLIGEALAKDIIERPAAYETVAAEADLAGEALAETSELLGADCQSDCWNDCCCPWWTVQAGAVILGRRARSALLIEDTLTGDPVLNANQFGSPWSGGPDIAIRRWVDPCRAGELRFFCIGDWHSRLSFTTPQIWNFPTAPPLLGLGVADIDTTYQARLYSTELNVRQATNEWLTWLAGLRYLELNEELQFDADFGGNLGEIDFNAGNHLYGGQVGAYVTIVDRCPYSLEGVFKAGVFGNAANQQVNLTQQIGPIFSARDSDGAVSFLGEIGLQAAYQWTDAVTLRAGYQLLWLEGIALAPDQVSAVQILSGDGITSRGGAFYHGAMISADMVW